MNRKKANVSLTVKLYITKILTEIDEKKMKHCTY